MAFYINGNHLKAAFTEAAFRLKNEKDTLNKLNIFPVADKDTGINMALSMEKTAAHISSCGCAAEVADDAYMQLLEYAHGNSGTILTLFFEGFADGLPADTEEVSGSQFAAAMLKGAENAMSGVEKPMSGTILSVAMQSALAGVSLSEVTDDVGEVICRITEEARSALLQTAHQNPVLKPFRVIDSGAYGFCLILDAFRSSVAPDQPEMPYPPFILPDTELQEENSFLYRYCTEFLLEPSADADLSELETALKSMGDCFLMAGKEPLKKVHIHTEQPEQVLTLASAYGTVRGTKVDDMLAPQ
ncbi:MAG: DAK2 domain-containing protein [Firmicutes bacterium]|nr:DAK2 domain-containing protein [Bacillota bacterium]MBR5489230.1 DAK2 domain-containing protein [Bacillota bacterium]